MRVTIERDREKNDAHPTHNLRLSSYFRAFLIRALHAIWEFSRYFHHYKLYVMWRRALLPSTAKRIDNLGKNSVNAVGSCIFFWKLATQVWRISLTGLHKKSVRTSLVFIDLWPHVFSHSLFALISIVSPQTKCDLWVYIWLRHTRHQTWFIKLIL